jgi:hypothetical protein
MAHPLLLQIPTNTNSVMELYLKKNTLTEQKRVLARSDDQQGEPQ